MKQVLIIISFAILLLGCNGNKTGADSDKNLDSSVKTVNAVSIYNNVPVRAEPQKEGKYLTSLNLGETMVFLGETVADSTNKTKEFYKVELSDGTIAWARTYGVVLDAEPAAIVAETPIYKRPDLVNKTDKAFYPMEFAVIVESKDDWVEVKGAKNNKNGWIKKQYLTTKKEEVAVATLAFKSILDDDGQVIKENVPKFMDELPYQNTSFTDYLQKIKDAQVEAAVVDAIKEYEADYYSEGESTDTVVN